MRPVNVALICLSVLLVATIAGFAIGFIVVGRATDSSQTRLNVLETDADAVAVQLGNSSVVAGRYGSLTEVPQITVASDGLVMDVSTIPATPSATASTYATRDSNGTSAFVSLNVGGSTQQALWFLNAGTTATDGILFGPGDTPAANLYRSASSIVRSSGDIGARHLYGFSAAIPTAVAGTGAGTSPTITVAAGSTDCKMQITVVTGTTPSAGGIIMTVTYNSAFINTLNKGVIFSPAGPNTAALSGTTNPYVSSETLSTFVFTAGSAALTNGTSYTWNFQVCT